MCISAFTVTNVGSGFLEEGGEEEGEQGRGG